MRKLLVIAAIILARGYGQGREWYKEIPSFFGNLTDGWQMAISTDKQNVFMDEPIWISLYVRNSTSARSQVAVHASDWLVADFKIQRFEGGPLVPIRPPKDKFDKFFRGGGSKTSHSVEPGTVSPLGLV